MLHAHAYMYVTSYTEDHEAEPEVESSETEVANDKETVERGASAVPEDQLVSKTNNQPTVVQYGSVVGWKQSWVWSKT